MTITVQGLTPAMQRERLRWLDEVWDDRGEAVRELVLASTVHPSLPPPCGGKGCQKCVACLFEDYRDARRIAADLESGAMSWQDFDETLSCPDRQEHAREEAAMWAAWVEDELVNGVRQRSAG